MLQIAQSIYRDVSRLTYRVLGTGQLIPDACYHCVMFNFGTPKTVGDWIVHIAGGIVALFLVWWMLRIYVF